MREAATTTAFDRDTAVRPLGDDAFAATIDAVQWGVPRGPNGGYIAAIVLRAMEHVVAPDRPARSLTPHYPPPPAHGGSPPGARRRGGGCASMGARRGGAARSRRCGREGAGPAAFWCGRGGPRGAPPRRGPTPRRPRRRRRRRRRSTSSSRTAS